MGMGWVCKCGHLHLKGRCNACGQEMWEPGKGELPETREKVRAHNILLEAEAAKRESKGARKR